MTPKNIPEGGKKEVILSAALEIFLENGYESTSVRSISHKVGCEVGLIYYYFKTKEELFDQALLAYYAKTEKEMNEISEQSTATVEKFIDYLEKKAISYRKTFANNVHFSIRTAVCEKITSLAEANLTKILEKTKRGEAKNIAVFLARGLCGAMLRDDADYYKENKDSIQRIVKSIVGTETREYVSQKREIPSFLL
jgi:AcrR family transcriptional regulator